MNNNTQVDPSVMNMDSISFEDLIQIITNQYQLGMTVVKIPDFDRARNIFKNLIPKIERTIIFTEENEMKELNIELTNKMNEVKETFFEVDTSAFNEKFAKIRQSIAFCKQRNSFYQMQDLLIELRNIFEERITILEDFHDADEKTKLQIHLIEIEQNISYIKFNLKFKQLRTKYDEIIYITSKSVNTNSLNKITQFIKENNQIIVELTQNEEKFPILNQILTKCKNLQNNIIHLKKKISENNSHHLHSVEIDKTEYLPYTTKLEYAPIENIYGLENLNEFIQELDNQFEEWDEKTLIKASKKL